MEWNFRGHGINDKETMNSPRVVDIVFDDFVGAFEKQRLVGAHLVKHDFLDRRLARSP
jgi:hypothetical protein